MWLYQLTVPRGVSCFIPARVSLRIFFVGFVLICVISQDILDADKFWKEELLKANKDRLFGCAYSGLDTSRNFDSNAKINGLIANHAYSVLRAVEVRIICRNLKGTTQLVAIRSTASVSSSCVIHGVKPSGQVHFRTVPKSGRQSGCKSCLTSATPLVTMGNLLWNVS